MRSGFEEMKASPWEKEDAMHEGIPIINFHVPKAFVHDNGKLTGMTLREGRGRVRRQGPARAGADRRAGRRSSNATTCWWRSDRRTPSRGSSATSASTSTSGACRSSITRTLQSTLPSVFFGGDAAFGPKNIIWAVAHGHEAAISIDQFCNGDDVTQRPAAGVTLVSQKMGIHEWSYDNEIAPDDRYKVPLARQSTDARRTSASRSSWASTSRPPGRRRSAA